MHKNIFYLLSVLLISLNASAYMNMPINCGLALGLPQVSLLRPLPIIKQDVNGKCGPSSLAIALAYFGRIAPLNPYNCFELSDLTTASASNIGLATGQIQGYADMLAKKNPELVDNLSQHIPGFASKLAQMTPEQRWQLAIALSINTPENLVTGARLFGLNAVSQQAGLLQIASYVGNQEVVLMYWKMGFEREGHWSPMQSIGPFITELRDPWPTSPPNNFLSIADFMNRSSTGIPGYFVIVRVSDHPLLPF
jgi:hypothetical protein